MTNAVITVVVIALVILSLMIFLGLIFAAGSVLTAALHAIYNVAAINNRK